SCGIVTRWFHAAALASFGSGSGSGKFNTAVHVTNSPRKPRSMSGGHWSDAPSLIASTKIFRKRRRVGRVRPYSMIGSCMGNLDVVIHTPAALNHSKYRFGAYFVRAVFDPTVPSIDPAT